MPSVECSAPCAYRSYNKYRQKKDGTYELNKFPGAGGPKGTCQHGTMIKIDDMWVCRTFEHWDTLSQKPTDAGSRRVN